MSDDSHDCSVQSDCRGPDSARIEDGGEHESVNAATNASSINSGSRSSSSRRHSTRSANRRAPLANSSPAVSAAAPETGFESATWECPVCLEAYPLAGSSRFSNVKRFEIDECKHAYCRACLKSYLREKINNVDLIEIKCPTPNCVSVLSEPLIRQVLGDEDEFKRILRFKRLAEQRRSNNVWCATPDCETALPASVEPRRRCGKCGRVTCTVCQRQHGDDEACNLRATADDEFILDKCRRCPGCATPVLKETGCNLVKCTSCAQRFCFLCGQRADYGHFSDPNSPCNGQLGPPARRELCIGLMLLAALLLCLVACTPLFACGAMVFELVRAIVVQLRRRRKRLQLVMPATPRASETV